MRHAFVRALSEAARRNKKIFLITGDLGFRILEPFAEEFPDRFLNIGVAEANLVTVAAGLATTGYIPFVYSIATFASMRPFEQIRDDVCLQNLNVKIVAIGGGLAYTKAGPTHHSMEDIGLMRLLPGMTIVAPKDPDETYIATQKIIAHRGPTYFRLERNPSTKVFHQRKSFSIGKGYMVKEGKDIALIATGVQVYNAIAVSSLLAEKGIQVGIYGLPTVQPLDTVLLGKIARKYRLLVSLEEHRTSGGLGSSIAEFISSNTLKPDLLRIGLKNIYTPISTDYESMLSIHEMLPAQIADRIQKISREFVKAE